MDECMDDLTKKQSKMWTGRWIDAYINMCICMHVYLSCMYLYICVYIIFAHICVFVCLYVNTCMILCTYVRICVHICLLICVYIFSTCVYLCGILNSEF